MSALVEQESVGDFIKVALPSIALKYEVPDKPAKNNIVVRLLSSDSESETRYHYRIDRDYQIVVYGVDAQDVLAKMDVIERKANDGTTLIPMKDSKRYIRIGSFSFSTAFKTEGGLYARLGVLSTEVREARTQEQYDKIMHVYGRFEAR